MAFKKKDTETVSATDDELISDDILKDIIRKALKESRHKDNIFECPYRLTVDQFYIMALNRQLLIRFRSTGVVNNRSIPCGNWVGRVFATPDLLVSDLRKLIAKYYPMLTIPLTFVTQ